MCHVGSGVVDTGQQEVQDVLSRLTADLAHRHILVCKAGIMG